MEYIFWVTNSETKNLISLQQEQNNSESLRFFLKRVLLQGLVQVWNMN